MLTKIANFSLVIPLALLSFAGIAINDNYELGIQGNIYFILLRTEFWLLISFIFNFNRISNFNYSSLNKNTKKIILFFPLMDIFLILLSTFINFIGKTGYTETINVNTFRVLFYLFLWFLWALSFIVATSKNNQLKFLEILAIMPLPNLIILAFSPIVDFKSLSYMSLQGIYSWGSRFQGVSSNPNVAAQVSFISLFALYVIFQKNQIIFSKLSSLLMQFAFFGNILIILLTGVRTIYISLTIFMIICFYRFFIKNFLFLLFGTSSFFLFLNLKFVDLFLPPGTFERGGRGELWNYYYKFLPNFFGYGINWKYFTSYREYIDDVIDPHNLYIHASLIGGTLLLFNVILKQFFLLRIANNNSTFKWPIISLLAYMVLSGYFSGNLNGFSQHIVPITMLYLDDYYQIKLKI